MNISSMPKSQLINLKSVTRSFKEDSRKNQLIRIDNRYILTTTKLQHQLYTAYTGVDTKQSKWIVAYFKLSGAKVHFSGRIKEQYRNLISAKVLWEGSVEINKTLYMVEVHERLGPSMRKMFETIEGSISPRQLIHLLLQILKLIQKLCNMRYVHGQLSPELICFDSNPKKNDIYLLNCFGLKKKNQQIKPICTKYCSRGSHHGRNVHLKDDLESIVYILTDYYLDRSVFANVEPQQLENKKNSLNLLEQSKTFPTPFIEFFCSVNNMNLTSEFDFYFWKNYLYKILTPTVVNSPFTWILANRENCYSFKEYEPELDAQREQLQHQQLLQLSENDMQKKQKMKGKVLKKISLQNIID